MNEEKMNRIAALKARLATRPGCGSCGRAIPDDGDEILTVTYGSKDYRCCRTCWDNPWLVEHESVPAVQYPATEINGSRSLYTARDGFASHTISRSPLHRWAAILGVELTAELRDLTAPLNGNDPRFIAVTVAADVIKGPTVPALQGPWLWLRVAEAKSQLAAALVKPTHFSNEFGLPCSVCLVDRVPVDGVAPFWVNDASDYTGRSVLCRECAGSSQWVAVLGGSRLSHALTDWLGEAVPTPYNVAELFPSTRPAAGQGASHNRFAWISKAKLVDAIKAEWDRSNPAPPPAPDVTR